MSNRLKIVQPNNSENPKPKSNVVSIDTTVTREYNRAQSLLRAEVARRRAEKALRAGAAILTLLIGYTTFKLGKQNFDGPAASKNRAETHKLEKISQGREALVAYNSVFVFNEGVKYRSSTDMIGDEGSDNNIVGKVKPGQKLVVKLDSRQSNDSGEWAGFRIVDNLSEPKAPGSVHKLAHDLVWVNVGELDAEQSRGDEEHYSRFVADNNANSDGFMVYISGDGQIHLPDGQPAAVGQFMDEQKAAQYTHNLTPYLK